MAVKSFITLATGIPTLPQLESENKFKNGDISTPNQVRRPAQNSKSTSSKPKRRGVDVEDEYLSEASLNSIPKRQMSSRKAKENCSNKWSQQKKLFDEIDDDDKAADLELSDSDDDATWKPSKKKQPSFGGFKDSQRNISFGQKRKSRGEKTDEPTSKKVAATSEIQEMTALVGDGQDFTIGDFVVLKEDVGKAEMPIWKFDSKTLLQKFTMTQSVNGDITYQSANLFSGFVPWSRAKYSSVAVAYVTKDKQRVKIIQTGSLVSATEKRKLSKEETSHNFESFEIYLQALVSQSIDPDFLEEIINDNDEYFVTSIKKIDEVTETRAQCYKTLHVRNLWMFVIS